MAAKMQAIPDTTKESISAGPVRSWAATPVSTKMPVPMMAPMPRLESCTGPSTRRRRFSPFISSSSSDNGLRAKSWLAKLTPPSVSPWTREESRNDREKSTRRGRALPAQVVEAGRLALALAGQLPHLRGSAAEHLQRALEVAGAGEAVGGVHLRVLGEGDLAPPEPQPPVLRPPEGVEAAVLLGQAGEEGVRAHQRHVLAQQLRAVAGGGAAQLDEGGGVAAGHDVGDGA